MAKKASPIKAVAKKIHASKKDVKSPIIGAKMPGPGINPAIGKKPNPSAANPKAKKDAGRKKRGKGRG